MSLAMLVASQSLKGQKVKCCPPPPYEPPEETNPTDTLTRSRQAQSPAFWNCEVIQIHGSKPPSLQPATTQTGDTQVLQFVATVRHVRAVLTSLSAFHFFSFLTAQCHGIWGRFKLLNDSRLYMPSPVLSMLLNEQRTKRKSTHFNTSRLHSGSTGIVCILEIKTTWIILLIIANNLIR